ncbi:MAG: VWA domain-containing protein [Planctomycetaceae bacterium]
MKRFLTCGDGPCSRARRGAMLILILVCLPVILAFAIFAINVAWMQLTRTELRTATDAAARSGSRMLSRSQDTAIARSWANAAALHNQVAGVPLVLAPTDVIFGNSAPDGFGGYVFSPRLDTDNDINATRVWGDRRSGSATGPVPMLFAGLFTRKIFEPLKTATATQIDRDVVLVLDRSGSMNTVTPTGTRWTDLKVAVQAFLNALATTPQDELVGVASYSTTSSNDQDMTLSYPTIMTTVNNLSPGGFTAIGKASKQGRIAVTDPAFARPTAQKTLVVMTDGIHNTGINPEIESRDAHVTYGITVHTITFSSSADQAWMQLVASEGGGQHWHADDQASLIAVFEEIAANLPTLLTE